MAEHAEPQVKTNVLRLLEGAAIPFRWFEYDVSDGKIDAVSISAKINEPPDQVFKTLVAQGPKRDHFVFVKIRIANVGVGIFVVCIIHTIFAKIIGHFKYLL